jgi:hypothetical protein
MAYKSNRQLFEEELLRRSKLKPTPEATMRPTPYMEDGKPIDGRMFLQDPNEVGEVGRLPNRPRQTMSRRPVSRLPLQVSRRQPEPYRRERIQYAPQQTNKTQRDAVYDLYGIDKKRKDPKLDSLIDWFLSQLR